MIFTFKCPGCAGNMRFNEQKQKMECLTCGVEVAVEEYDAKEIMIDGGQKCGEDTSIYRCPSCGAEMLTENLQVTCSCRWCGTEMAVFGNMEDKIRPEKVIPFSVSKEEAVNHFNRWWMEHDSLPKYDQVKMKFDIHPLYLPVWLIDANVQTDITAVVRTDETEDNLSSYGNKYDSRLMTSSYAGMASPQNNVKTRKYYLIRKVISSVFRSVPSIASYHFSSTRFQGIEPYDYTQLQDFTPAYLSGFPAEQYSIEAQDVIPKTIKRVRDFGKDQCRTHICTNMHTGAEIETEKASEGATELKEICYALVPVWICSYTYNNKKRMVYVNGQTGKTDGEVVMEEERNSRDFLVLALANFWECLGLLMVNSVFWRRSTFRRRHSVSLIELATVLGLLHVITGNFSLFKKKNSYTDVSPNISWRNGKVIKHLQGPAKAAKLKFILGTIFFVIGIGGYGIMGTTLQGIKLSQVFPVLIIASIIIAVIGTLIYLKKYIKDQNRQDTAEYTDYVQAERTVVLESSEQPWVKA